jgi:hypothetical protein
MFEPVLGSRIEERESFACFGVTTGGSVCLELSPAQANHPEWHPADFQGS